MKREKEYLKSAKTRSKVEKTPVPPSFELASSEDKQDWLNEFYEGME
jgi:hypothetical protein